MTPNDEKLSTSNPLLGDINQYFSKEDIEKLKKLAPLSAKEEEYLHKLSNAIIDRLEEEIQKGRLKLPEK